MKHFAAAKARLNGTEVKKQELSLLEIENIFVLKLQEKYHFTEKDINKVFIKFDKDGSGHLSVDILAQAVGCFVNGVDPTRIHELVTYYDADGDGEISVKEFSSYIMTRSAVNPDDWITVDKLIENRGNSRTNETPRDSYDKASTLVPDLSDPVVIEHHGKLLLQNLRSTLVKIAGDIKKEGKVPLIERLSNHSMDLAEIKARDMLAREFFPYTTKRGATHVDFITMSRIIQKYINPGLPSPRTEILEYVYARCGGDLKTDAPTADPNSLAEIIFDKGGHVVNKFGFRQNIAPATDTGRPDNAVGPFFKSGGEKPVQIAEVPLKFLTRRCKTALATPSDFDPKLVQRSSRLPRYECKREFVYGINVNLSSGPRVWSLSATQAQSGPVSPPGEDERGRGWTPFSGVGGSKSSARGGGAQQRQDNRVVYAGGALGIVHDLASNTQDFFDGHDDDVTCISVSPDGSLAATGQVGRSPEACVWYTSLQNPSMGDDGGGVGGGDGPRGLVGRYGKGFFSRGVCALDISPDNVFLVGISCDDKHSIGVWRIGSREMVVESTSANGIPPQVMIADSVCAHVKYIRYMCAVMCI